MITLPWPPPALSPNARPHHMVKARAVKRYRRDAAIATRAGSWPALPATGDIALEIEFRPPTTRRRDLDNAEAMIKAGLDGIADVIGVDDSRFRISKTFGPVVCGGAVQVTFVGRVADPAA